MWDFDLTKIGCEIDVLVSLALTPVHNTAIGHMSASNAAGSTVQPAARRTTPHRPLVLYVEAIIPQITKDVTYIKTISR